MKKQTRYTNEPMAFEIIEDFLPSPAQLARRNRKVKVTLEVEEPTVEMFRKNARGSSANSRRMMGQLLDFYATKRL